MKKTIEKQILILSPDGIVSAPITVEYRDGDGFSSEVRSELNKKTFRGVGESRGLEQAFADLEKNLPENCSLRCCMVCRHGNFCPFGGAPGQLFCTKDKVINSKDDMIALFSDKSAFGREVFAADNYGDFVRQDRDHYTYNGFLYYCFKD